MRKPTICIAARVILAVALLTRPADAGYVPLNEEQYVLELINRSRMDPDAEVYRYRAMTWGDTGSPQAPDLNEGLAAGTISDSFKQPVTFNTSLIQAARDYSTTLLTNNSPLTHTYGGTTPQTRDTAAGYVYSGSWSWGENLAFAGSTLTYTLNQSRAGQQHIDLFIDGDVAGRGHRTNIMTSGWKEVGVGFAYKAGYTGYGSALNSIISTYDYAYSGGSSSGNPFITGVVTNDTTDNNFYDTGEGLGSITVSAVRTDNATFSTTTWTSGGYSLAVPAGTYTVTISGAGLTAPIVYHSVAVSTTNVKLDASSDMGVWGIDSAANWTTASNWTGVAPSGAGTTAVFAGKITAPRTITLDAARTVGSLLFRSAQPYTIGGSNKLTLSLAAASARIDVLAGSHTISAPISLPATDIEVLNSADTLTMSGAIDGSGLITKLGKGTLLLSGNNTNTGGHAVVDGTVQVAHSNALGTGGTISLGFGSNTPTLAITTNAVNIARPITVVSGTGTRTLSYTPASGAGTFSGAITLQRDLALLVGTGGQLNLTGGINDTGAASPAGLAKSGSGTAIITGNNTYTGATTVSVGTLQVGTASVAGSIAASSGVTVASSASFVAGSNTTVKTLNLSASNSNATILAGALRVLTIGDGTSDSGLLDISGTSSKLDLNSGAMVLNFNSAGEGAGLRDSIKSLIGTGNTGKIMSSRVTAANLANPNTPMGIGYALGDYTAVGLPSDATSIVARYTLVGDANLDGVVDVGDLGTALAPNYGSNGKYWQEGDFNGDGAVDTSDLALLAANYGKTLTLPGDAVGNLNLNFEQDLAQAFASVPEPGTLILGLAALALLKRRNRTCFI